MNKIDCIQNASMRKVKKEQHKEQKKQEKIARRDAKWLATYGITYTDAILKLDKDKKKNKHHFLFYTKFAFKQIKGNKSIFLFLVTLEIVGAICSFFGPVFVEKFIASLESANYSIMINYGLLAVLFMALSNLIGYFLYQKFNVQAVRTLGNSLRIRVVEKLLNTKQSKYETVGSGEIINKTQHAPTWFIERLGDAIGTFAYVSRDIALCFYLAFLDIRLLSILLLGGLISSIILIVNNTKRLKKYDILQEKVNDKLYNNFGEIVRGSADIKLLNNKQTFLSKVDKLQDYQKNVSMKYVNNQFVVEGMLANAFFFGCQVVFVIVSVLLLKEHAIGVSVVLLCLMYRYDILALFEEIVSVFKKFTKCEVMAQRVYEVFNEEEFPSEQFGNVHLNDIKGQIEFKDVCLSYEDGKQVLNNLNFNIAPNQKVAFVGESGGGKSTTIRLISKLIEANSGSVLIDGIDIKDLDEQTIRSNISLVSQSPYIFNGTIKDNLLLACPDATDEELYAVLKQTQLYDFVLGKPDKLDTKIGESGIKLSGGQRQRLAIARALLKRGNILLLDEATSALDNFTQEEIKKVINTLTNQTIVIVAHRLSTIVDCDCIMLLKQGQIVCAGSHKELMKTSKEYQNLYKTEENKESA